MSVPKALSLAVVVTCHAGYLKWLPGCLESINSQQVEGVQKILVMDGAEVPLCRYLEGWDIVKGNWGNPNNGRNAALGQIQAEWVLFVDADNMMPDNYLHLMRQYGRKVEPQVAICYPDVIRVGSCLKAETTFVMPEWDFWTMRERSLIDTSSLWRTRALREVGGWTEGIGMLDDYCLALKITRAGWTAKKAVGAVSVLRQHGDRRSGNREAMPEACWTARSLAIVTLCSGRQSFWRVLEWLKSEPLPPNTHLYWVDDSQSEAFRGAMHGAAWGLQRQRKVTSATIMESRPQSPNVAGVARGPAGVSPAYWAVHRRVAALYNQALAGLQEDLVMLLEDDVVPPQGAAKQLCAPLLPFTKTAAVGAVYRSRDHAHLAVCSMNKQRWQDVPRLDRVPQALHEVGMIAGGCTVWNNAMLRKVLPMQVTEAAELGWDGTACRRANDLGFHFKLDGRLTCEHLCD